MTETAKIPTTATETTFACGHTEIHGGNLADPTFIYADMRVYRQDAGLCAVCREPEKYRAVLEWKPSGDSPLEKVVSNAICSACGHRHHVRSRCLGPTDVMAPKGNL